MGKIVIPRPGAIIRDENKRKRMEKPYFYFCFYILDGNGSDLEKKMELKMDGDIR
jgi:hypothetical protein